MSTDNELAERETIDLLTAALSARTAQVGEHDLRPAAPPVASGARILRLDAAHRVARSRWLRPVVSAAAVAAVAGAIVVGNGLPGSESPSRPDTSAVAYVVSFAGGSSEDQPLEVELTPHDQPIDGTRATTSYPLVNVTGGSTTLERRITDAVNARIVAEVADYRHRLAALGADTKPLTQTITVRSDAQWGHTVSIVLDVVDDFGGAVPSNSSTAVVIDKRTGSAVAATGLFTDVDAVDATMRTAIRQATEPMPSSRRDLASLTMRAAADELTTPLTWYPTDTGLHWVVDRGAVASDAQGEPAATVPWSDLAGLVAPGMMP
jgi:hypothetical protein